MSDDAGNNPPTEASPSYKKKSGKPMFIIVVVAALVVGLMLGTVIGSVFLQEEQKGGALDRILERGELIVGTNVPWEPFEWYNLTSEKYEGIDIAVVQAIADELGVDLVIKSMDFKALIGAVQTGQIDIAISSITILPDRAESVDFSIPYYTANQAVLVHESANITYAADLDGLKVGAQADTTGAYYVSDHWVDNTTDVDFTPYPELSGAVLALDNDLVDAIVVDTPVANRYANDASYDFKVAFTIQTDENYGIACPKDNPALKYVIDNVIEKILSDGTMDDILTQYT